LCPIDADYLHAQDYDLGDINQSNDAESLRQLCFIDIRIERIHNALAQSSAGTDPKKWRSLTSSLKDLTNASSTIQNDLGIVRRKRMVQEDVETPLKYIETLKEQAKNIIDKRLKKLICPACNQLIMKYHKYVMEDGERGAIALKGKQARLLSMLIRVECPKCYSTVVVDETGETRLEAG
jgi:hypothetical protein